MIRKFLRILFPLLVLVCQTTAKAEDIDLFVGGSPSATVLPNVLIIVDNTANWNTVFEAEKAALVSVFNGLPLDKFRVGLMLYSEAGGGNGLPGGAYVRAALRAMDATNRPLYASMVGALSNANPNSDKASGRALGLSMAEAYLYFSAGTAYAGANKVKRDYPSNSVSPTSFFAASNNVYARPGNAFASSSATVYTSPINDGCQRNFIIYIGNTTAGGNVTQDNNSDNETSRTILVSKGGDATQVTNISPVGFSDNYANEWTRFMKASAFAISTYTVDVSLGTAGNGPANSALLKSMANEGGGKYFQINGNAPTVGADIERALAGIFSEIQSVNSVFASVSLPVSVNTQGTFLNQVFVGMFRPDVDSSPRWAGNLKQYKLGTVNGAIKLQDSTGASAINNQTGFIAECAKSYWTPDIGTDSYWSYKSWPTGTTFCIPPSGSAANLYKNSNSPDGNIVEKGAQAYKLRQSTTRTMFTCGATMTGCTSLTAVNSTTLSVTALGAASTTEQNSLINWAKGLDVSDEDGDAVTLAEMRPSAHGDVVHSRPVAVNFATSGPSQVAVFYGGNDGILRAVNGNRGDISGSVNIVGVPPGGELWAFLAPEFYGKIKRIKDNTTPIFFPTAVYGTGTTPIAKGYGMDGPITAFNGSVGGTTKTFVYSTMRRGGRSIYAFDVTNTLTAPTSPTLKWRIGCADSTDADCTAGFVGIGQTWASMKSFTTAGYGSGSSPLLIFGGGYDNCEDFDGVIATQNANNTCSSSSKGHFVYVVDANTGARIAALDTLGTRGVIADVTLVRNGAGQVIYGYTADLGGNVYRITFGSGVAATWTITKIASLGCADTSPCPANRKFMFAPSVVALGNDVYGIMLGSGDREKPLTFYSVATAMTNYFFQFYDKPAVATSTWPGTGCGSAVICLDSLLPISGNTTPTDELLSTKKGWYLSMTSSEQVVTSAVTIFGVVTFSTHQPAVPAAGSCTSNLGTTRVYSVGFTNAASANGTGERWEDVAGDGLPPSPVAGRVTLDDGTTVPFCIGCSKDSPLEGSPPKVLASVIQPKNRLYWYIQK